MTSAAPTPEVEALTGQIDTIDGPFRDRRRRVRALAPRLLRRVELFRCYYNH